MRGFVPSTVSGFQYTGYRMKPSYEYSSAKKVIVPASATSPAYFVLGSRAFTVTATLTCNANVTGAGGLTDGTFSANTIYYLYGVLSSNQVKLLLDHRPPTVGPSGFEAWTYLGACPTYEGSAAFAPFIATSGVLMSDNEIETESHNGDTSLTTKTFESMPTTAKHGFFLIQLEGTSADSNGRIVGRSGESTNNGAIQELQVSGVENFNTGWVPMFTAQTVYVLNSSSANTLYAYLMGWREAPHEFQ